MRISRVEIVNFRSFKHLNVELGQNLILIGENKTGKSNFIEALRLILDPSLSDTNRRLGEQDFWDGIEPFKGNEIRVTIQFADFANDSEPDYLQLSLLTGETFIKNDPQPVAQLTYIYENTKKLDEPEKSGYSDYDYNIYAGNNFEKPFNMRPMRRNIPIEKIDALRDIVSDNRVWRRSPLNRLVELSDLDTEHLEPFAQQVRLVSDQVLNLLPLSDLQTEIQRRLENMVGNLYAVEPQIGLNATTASALEEDLRLFIDGDRRRTLDRTSLGLQNALYLALLSLLLEKQEVVRSQKEERFIPIIALEEPEAHLHPHLQRLVFHDFLDRARNRKQPVIVTTHSPYLVCVAEIEDLVFLKDYGSEGCQAVSAYKFSHELTVRERKDLDRFLDITKSEMLFAKGIIFVEGDVEVLLISTFVEILDIPLDQYGITVCNVYGTNFLHVVTLANQLSIPFVVLTDGDKLNKDNGLKRGVDLFKIVDADLHSSLSSLLEQDQTDEVRGGLAEHGVFVNEWTLEVTFFDVGLEAEMKQVFRDLGEEIGQRVRASIQHIDNFLADRSDDNMDKILTSIDDPRWRKGRFAHRLSQYIADKAAGLDTQEEKNALVPEYIRNAIEYLIDQIRAEKIADQDDDDEAISTAVTGYSE